MQKTRLYKFSVTGEGMKLEQFEGLSLAEALSDEEMRAKLLNQAIAEFETWKINMKN